MIFGKRSPEFRFECAEHGGSIVVGGCAAGCVIVAETRVQIGGNVVAVADATACVAVRIEPAAAGGLCREHGVCSWWRVWMWMRGLSGGGPDATMCKRLLLQLFIRRLMRITRPVRTIEGDRFNSSTCTDS